MAHSNNSLCEYPACRDTASRKFPEMVESAGRTCCVFRLFCAAHIPADVLHMTAPVRSEPPTHNSRDGQIHVPRVWEVTGQRPADALASDREWRKSHELISARTALADQRRRGHSAAIRYSGTRTV